MCSNVRDIILEKTSICKFVVVLERGSEFRNKNNGIPCVSLLNCVCVCGFFYLFISCRGWRLNLRDFLFPVEVRYF